MPKGVNGRSRSVFPRLLSERAALAYFVSAMVGIALVIASHFFAIPWFFWAGLILLLPLIGWLIALLGFALPILVVLRGFSTRRDDGSLSDEK